MYYVSAGSFIIDCSASQMILIGCSRDIASQLNHIKLQITLGATVAHCRYGGHTVGTRWAHGGHLKTL